jgi:hypothetical protein
MSAVGNSVAAGVAQTVQNAQQVARQRDQQDTEHSSDGRVMRDLFDSHLQAFEDSNHEGSAAHLHVDGQMPEHQSQQQDGRPQHQPNPQPLVVNPSDVAPPVVPKVEPDAPLYRHLDVKA